MGANMTQDEKRSRRQIVAKTGLLLSGGAAILSGTASAQNHIIVGVGREGWRGITTCGIYVVYTRENAQGPPVTVYINGPESLQMTVQPDDQWPRSTGPLPPGEYTIEARPANASERGQSHRAINVVGSPVEIRHDDTPLC